MYSAGFQLAHQLRESETQASPDSLARHCATSSGLAQGRLADTDALGCLASIEEAISEWRLRDLLPHYDTDFLENGAKQIGMSEDTSDQGIGYPRKQVVGGGKIGAEAILGRCRSRAGGRTASWSGAHPRPGGPR